MTGFQISVYKAAVQLDFRNVELGICMFSAKCRHYDRNDPYQFVEKAAAYAAAFIIPLFGWAVIAARQRWHRRCRGPGPHPAAWLPGIPAAHRSSGRSARQWPGRPRRR